MARKIRPYQDVVWTKCIGEAHSKEVAGHIDHCMICMPWWETYPACPECKRKLRLAIKFFICDGCGSWFYKVKE